MEDGHFAELKEAELLEDKLQALDSIQSYIGTFFSKEYVLKKVLRFTDAEVIEMRDQIAKELDTDPMDGGIVLPDAGDGITRYPQDAAGAALGADDVAKLHGQIPPADQAKQAKAKADLDRSKAKADLDRSKADDPDLKK